MNNKSLLRVRGLEKHYGGVTALGGVDFSVRSEEIVALVGDNGAGKSTLIKTIAGAIKASAGEILWKGEEVNIDSPRKAMELGIETVYQHLALIEQLDTPANIFLGRELTKFSLGDGIRFMDKASMKSVTRGLLEQLGIHVDDLTKNVRNLSGGQRQSIAISRALYSTPELLILDEPTSEISIKETEEVLDLMTNLRDSEGISVIFITHTLQEAFQVADRIVALRDGEKALDTEVKDTTRQEVVSAMIG